MGLAWLVITIYNPGVLFVLFEDARVFRMRKRVRRSSVEAKGSPYGLPCLGHLPTDAQTFSYFADIVAPSAFASPSTIDDPQLGVEEDRNSQRQ
jgi:hypothetical protein